jgi:Glyoxalase-like domain
MFSAVMHDPPWPGVRAQDWLILTSPAGGAALAFQKVGELPGATWPDGPVPQQLHLAATVPAMADLDVQHERALALGARLLEDRSDDPEETLRSTPTTRGTRFASVPLLSRSRPPAE